MDQDIVLQLKDVRRAYDTGDMEVEVLHGINLTIRRGEMVAIIGPSGSGKSTLMNIIGCLDTPSSGSYYVLGQDTKDMSSDDLATLRRDFFGFIFQRYHLLSHLKATENVQVPAIYAGVKKHKREERAFKILKTLGLQDRVDHLPTQLSGGQQQRVSIARALMNGGQFILADEPTGALDTKSGQDVMRILQELNANGHTIIIVTHDPRIAALARRVVSIEDGSITSDVINEKVADPRSLRDHSHDQESPEEENSESEKINLNDDLIKLNDAWSHSFSAYIDRFKEAFVMAYRAMIANRMRTLLTMLGIIIGIMAVVSVVALARGASEKVLAQIASMGTNNITVYPGERMGDVRKGKVRTLTPRDLVSLQGQPFVDSVSASIQTSTLIRRGAIDSNANIHGVSSELFRVYGLELDYGRYFSQDDLDKLAQVCIIDQNTAKLFFANEDPLGKSLIVSNMGVKVIGVLKPSDSFILRGDNPTIFLPYTSVMTRVLNQNYLSSIVVRISDGFSAPVAEAAIKKVLISRHGREDFFLYSTDSIMKNIESATLTFTLMISAIAVISLVVGGIGVMNIMLVSVTERTKEIGIRMAVGARQSDIMAQFLIEAIMVCMIGGLCGVLASYAIGNLIMTFVPSITLTFSLDAILAAVITSTIIGVVFGFMPARSASALNPIDALARE